MTDRLLRALGIVIPILQAPTGSVAGPELAAAVSRAGGLGGMGLTWAAPEDAAAAVRQVRKAIGADRPFLVNYALSFAPVTLPLVLECGAPVVAFSWGDAAPHARRVHEAGAKVVVQVANAHGARRALDAGADALICQGVEAGGHVQSTTALDDLLAAALTEAGGRAPVVAAGGLATGADIARVLRLGADGAMLGTRFVATRESRAHPAYKARLCAAAGAGETALTICFDGGWPHAPHRVLRNPTLDAWEAAGCPPPNARPGEGEAIARAASGESILRYEDTAPRADMTGDVEAMALYAGTGVGRIADVPPAGDLLRRLWAEAQAALAPEA